MSDRLRRSEDLAERLQQAAPRLDERTRARMERRLIEAAAARSAGPGPSPSPQSRPTTDGGSFASVSPSKVGGWSKVGWAVAAAAVAAAVALLSWREEPSPAVARFEVIGAESSARRGTLEEGSVLPTGPSEQGTIRISDSRIRLGADSRLRVGTLRAGRLDLELLDGEVEVAFHPERPGEQGLSIATEQARVEVVGTVFSVRARQGTTRIAVSEGVVRVVSLADGSARLVRSGQQVEVLAPALAAGPAAAAEPPRSLGLGGAPLGAVEGAPPSPPEVAEPVAPSAEAPSADPSPADRPEPSDEPSPEAAGSATTEAPGRRLAQARRLVQRAEHRAAEELLRRLVRAPDARAIRGPAWTLLGDLAQRDGRLADAATAYERASAASEPMARANAIYALARLQERRLGQPDAARVSYHRYLQVAPDGPLAPQARQALCRLGDEAACASER